MGLVMWPEVFRHWAEPTKPRAQPNPQQLELGKEGTRTEEPVCVLYWWISQVIHELNGKTENDGTFVLYIRNVWANWSESIYRKLLGKAKSMIWMWPTANTSYISYIIKNKQTCPIYDLSRKSLYNSSSSGKHWFLEKTIFQIGNDRTDNGVKPRPSAYLSPRLTSDRPKVKTSCLLPS